MASLYWIGVVAGLGTAIGMLFAGLAGGGRLTAAAALAAAALGAAIGFAVKEWDEALGGALGGLAGALGAAQIVRGTLRRGGTRGGTGVLVGLGALGLAAIALVPGLGYVEAVALPAIGARLRRRGGERYAGLRILARDK